MSDVSFDARLAAIDLSRVMARVRAELDITDDEALLAEAGYRQFLKLHHLHPDETIVPTRLVDEVWHNHVLHTRQYAADCQTLFGEMLHHEPMAGVDLTADFNRTNTLLASTFGEGAGCGLNIRVDAYGDAPAQAGACGSFMPECGYRKSEEAGGCKGKLASADHHKAGGCH